MTAGGVRPIGGFDSGVGGLTVLCELMRRFPNDAMIYLGDTAGVPYGSRSPDVVATYSRRNAEFLMSHNIKLLVVACNTVSAVALPQLEKQINVPVLGVIEPGASAAVAATKNGNVAVIGTPGTIRSGAYQ